MEEDTSGDESALLASMRALARRGAELRKIADGAGVIEQADERRPARQISPGEFLEMLDWGWIRSSGMDRFVISKRGVTALRSMLSRPKSAAGKSEPPSEASPDDEPVRRVRAAAARPDFNLKESPLAWLARRQGHDGKPMITAAQFEAGERLRADFERGNMGPRLTASWNPAASPSGQSRSAPGIGVDMADSVVAARQRVEAALKAVGPDLSGVLLDVCCFLKGLEQIETECNWSRRSGKIYLNLALKHLARHYGIAERHSGASRKVRIWHDDGWSPTGGNRSTSDEDPSDD